MKAVAYSLLVQRSMVKQMRQHCGMCLFRQDAPVSLNVQDCRFTMFTYFRELKTTHEDDRKTR